MSLSNQDTESVDVLILHGLSMDLVNFLKETLESLGLSAASPWNSRLSNFRRMPRLIITLRTADYLLLSYRLTRKSPDQRMPDPMFMTKSSVAGSSKRKT